jgi:hypothetical protein
MKILQNVSEVIWIQIEMPARNANVDAVYSRHFHYLPAVDSPSLNLIRSKQMKLLYTKPHFSIISSLVTMLNLPRKKSC